MFTAQIGDLMLSGVDASGVLWGVEDVDGWGATKSRVSQTARPRQSGSWSGAKFAEARSVAVSGGFTAPDPLTAQAALDRLYAAVSLEETPLRIAEAGSPRWATVYQTGEVIPKWITPRDVEWSFQVASDDWRKFGDTVTGSTGLPSTSGGLSVPFSIPFAITSTVAAGQVSLSNPGNQSGPVTLRIDGPVRGPVVTHVSSGASLVFASSLELQAGEFLVVDMEGRTVLANGQASRSGYVTSRGWSAFDPGANTWAFSAAAYQPGALLTVTATTAYK